MKIMRYEVSVDDDYLLHSTLGGCAYVLLFFIAVLGLFESQLWFHLIGSILNLTALTG